MRLLAVVALGISSAAASIPVQSRIEGVFFGSLVADALSLGSHYEYDAKVIKQAYGATLSRYYAPGELTGGAVTGAPPWGQINYHPGQKAGDQTDYGEYNILILEHLANRQKIGEPNLSRMSFKDLFPYWLRKITSPSWGAWKCTQSKETLDQIVHGVSPDHWGGTANAMAIRNVAAFAVYQDESDIVDSSAVAMFTHRNSEAHTGSEFFSRVTFRIIHKGLTPRQAIDEVAKESSPWVQQKAKQGIDKFYEATDLNQPLSKEELVDDLAISSMVSWDIGNSESIKVGKSSDTEGTLPGSIYIILKYQEDPIAAFKANAMVGGDSASRAIAIGMVLGAYHGVAAIPQDLKQNLKAWTRCEHMLRSLPLLAQAKAEW